jgi:hypothetical protein
MMHELNRSARDYMFASGVGVIWGMLPNLIEQRYEQLVKSMVFPVVSNSSKFRLYERACEDLIAIGDGAYGQEIKDYMDGFIAAKAIEFGIGTDGQE